MTGDGGEMRRDEERRASKRSGGEEREMKRRGEDDEEMESGAVGGDGRAGVRQCVCGVIRMVRGPVATLRTGHIRFV